MTTTNRGLAARRNSKCLACALLALLALLACTQTVRAQTPVISVSGLPAAPLIGEEFCVTGSFSNASTVTGYGPYFIVVIEPGVTRLSIDFVDIPPVLELIGTFDASAVLTDPISGITLNGVEGGIAWIARYPVGSVEQGKPPLDMDVCGVVDTGAEIGVPKNVQVIPGFEFGSTSTGSGAVTGASFDSTVTPQLARVAKSNSAPESERPPGPSHAFQYRWEVSVSQGVAINNLVLSDDLPPEIQWTGGPVTVAAPLGVGCSVTSLPNAIPTPGGTVSVECSSVLGRAGDGDLLVSVPVFISDILDETQPDFAVISNTVDFNYDYRGDSFSTSDNSNVEALHAAVQKSVSGTGLPGGILSYVIGFQLTDYPGAPADAGADTFIIQDILADGLRYDGTVALVINGSSVPISPSVVAGPGSGETTVTWDIADAAGGRLDNASSGSLTFEATILDSYADGDPVQASDVFSNAPTLDYSLSSGGSGSDSSQAAQDIRPNTPDKTILSPNPLPPSVSPGDEIVFELSLNIPAGNTSGVVLTDYLPRPVFDVADFNPATDISVAAPFASLNPSVTTDLADNAVILDFGDIRSPVPATLRVQLAARVVGEPFADGLFLTNLLASRYNSSDGRTINGLQAAAIGVGAPELVISKGVVGTDNPAAVITPPAPENPRTENANSNVEGVDAFDELTYVITVENIGGAPAFNVTIDDIADDGLACAEPAPGDIVNGANTALRFSGSLAGGIVLTDPLASNDGSPGAPYGRDTALLTVRCVLGLAVEPRQTLSNEGGASWTSTASSGSPFPRVSDTANAVIGSPVLTKSLVEIDPGYSTAPLQAHIGELLTYELIVTVPEGTSTDVRLEDRLPNGLAAVDVLSITPSSADLSTSEGSFGDVLSNAGFNAIGGGDTSPDRRLVFGPANNAPGFGTIVNSNSDNATEETITVRYRAKVLNASVNRSGRRKRNRARWVWRPTGGPNFNVQVRADPVRLVESRLQLEKAFTPDAGDESTPPLVTLTLSHARGSRADAFDVSLSDSLPFNMRVDGTIDSSGCTVAPTTGISDIGLSDRIGASWDSFPLGASCTLSFLTRFVVNPLAGRQLENCAESMWESVLDSDQPLAMPPNNTLGAERTGDSDNPGQLNNYLLEACDVFRVLGVGVEKRLLSTNQGHTDGIAGTPPGAESLTIGEIAVFELILTIADTSVAELEVTDLLPVTDNVLELISARTTSVGSDLSPVRPDPTPLIDDRDGDGINDRAVLNYGFVGQAADGITDERDRIRIEVVAKVRDERVNENNDNTSNGAIARYLPGITSSDSFPLEIVEPLLSISKTADTSRAEAGDIVTYTLRIEHRAASRIDARDLNLRDMIPAQLDVDPTRVSTGAVCDAPPDSGPVLAGGEINASWTSFPLGAVCEIEYEATVNVSAVVGQTIVNAAEIGWTSLDTQGDPDDRLYDRQDSWNLSISEPGIFKSITDLAVGDFVLGAPGQELTIGEMATFTIVADFPDGTTEQAFVSDRLPSTDVALAITRTELISIGSDLSLSSGALAGDAALDCSPGATFLCAEWILGDVVNTPDNRPEPDLEDSVVFEIEAIVVDSNANSGAPGEDKNLQNLAQLRSRTLNVSSSANFDLIEPQLGISKLTDNGTLPSIVVAGERKRFTLEIKHAASSTDTARNIRVRDTLNSDMLWIGDSTVSSDCPGFSVPGSVVSSPATPPPATGVVEFAFDELSLSDGNCQISYEVEATGAGFPVPSRFPNSAELTWESAPGSAESRSGSASASNFLVSLSTATLGKIVSGTSVPDTARSNYDPLTPDLTIGEVVRYEIVAAFSEGQQTDVVLTDTLQADDPSGPILELLGGNVLAIGANLTTSQPGVPVVGPANVITVDYGTVDNLPDMVLDGNDTIVYELIARVANVPNNVAGVTLSNTVALDYAGAAQPETTFVDIEIVEPALSAGKSFTDLSDGVASIEMTVENTGNASAYELRVTDAFDESFWLPGSLREIRVPAGFTLTESSSGGITTVTLQTLGDPSRPEQVLAPGELLTVNFSMELINGGIVGVTQIDNTIDVQATSLPGIDPAERSYSTSATDSLFFPELSLEKTWSGPNNPALPGDTLTYTLTLENSGQAPATDVLITDTPDAIAGFQAGTVAVSGGGTVVTGNAPGDSSIVVTFASLADAASAAISYDVQVPLPYPDGVTAPEQLSNQASADAKEQQGILSDDPNTAAAADPTVVPVQADPQVQITKDDQLLLTAPGATIEYLIDYGNTGNQDATGVLISETVPANTVYSAADSTPGWSCADGSGPGTTCEFNVGNLSLAPGSVSFAVLVDTPLPPAVTQIENTVAITDDGIEFDPGAPVVPSTDSATEQTPIGGAFPQLAIEKDDGGIGVTPGQRYSYLIDYRNIGNQGATGVVITETVPDDVAFSAVGSLPSRWSCPNGSPPGTTCTITVPLLLAQDNGQARFGLDVNFPAAAGRELIINSVDITDDGGNSPAPSTDSDTDDTPLIAVPDIYVSKQSDANIVRPGDSIIYTAIYGNQGNQNATGVVVREIVPPGTVFNAANSAPTAWSCADGADAGTLCEYQAGAVDAGFMETLMFAIDIVGIPENRQIVNVIEANDDFSNGPDPVPGNNIDRVLNLFPSLSVDTMSRAALILLSLMLMIAATRQARGRR